MTRRPVLQICHGYNPPFLELANQYARLFDPDRYTLTTLYLRGERRADIETRTASERVVFFELDARSLKGLKIGVVKRLRALMKAEGFALVLCHRYKSIYLAGLARVGLPEFAWAGVVHDFKVFAKLPRRLFIHLLGGGLTVLGVSRAIRENVARDCPRLGDRVFSLPNSLDVEGLQTRQLARADARQRLGLPQDGFIFGNVGRLHPVKDQETLLKGFARAAMPGASLVLMGEGEREAALKTLARDLGLTGRVRFLGMVPDGPHYFKALDVFVLTSSKEPFGMVLLEAMAAGVPVISSRTGGTEEVVGDCGLLFEPGDADRLAACMRASWEWDADARQQLIERAARRLNDHFSPEAFRHAFWSLPFTRDV